MTEASRAIGLLRCGAIDLLRWEAIDRDDEMAKMTDASRGTGTTAPSTTFGDRYAWMRAVVSEPVPFELFHKRAQTALRRARVKTWGHLVQLTDESLHTLPNVGTPTILHINEVLEFQSHTSRSRADRNVTACDDGDHVEMPVAVDHARQLTIAAEWARAAAGQTTLGGLLGALDDNLPVPAEVAAEVERLLASPIPYAPSLSGLIERLLGEALDPELFVSRECVREKPTFKVLGRERGVTGEYVRRKVASDGKAVRERIRSVEYRPIRWAIDRFRSEVGLIRMAESAVVHSWQKRLGEPAFEVLRWLSGYSYKDGWLQKGSALGELKAQVDATVGDEWLVLVEQLVREVPAFGDAATAVRFLVETGKWRDIGNGWLVRWDGPIQAKIGRAHV